MQMLRQAQHDRSSYECHPELVEGSSKSNNLKNVLCQHIIILSQNIAE
jgi:hypothetical protein